MEQKTYIKILNCEQGDSIKDLIGNVFLAKKRAYGNDYVYEISVPNRGVYLIKPECAKVIMQEEKIEKDILEYISESWNLFSKLPQTHPSDIEDFAQGVHDLQKVIGMRMIRRERPDVFPTKKG